MMHRYLLPLLAIVGAFLGLIVVYWTQQKVPTPPILYPPPQSPYLHSIAAAGTIEASSQNIAIGTPFNEIVTEVFVIEGDYVKKGDPLFQLDRRFFEAQLTAAEASVNASKATLVDRTKQFSYYHRLNDKNAVSEQAYQQAHYGFLEAEENLKVAKANLDLAKVNIERSTIRAPFEGKILQVNINPGEIALTNPFAFAQSNAQSISQGSLILMGKVVPMQVRINIDEDDAWRYMEGSEATAFIRGNSSIHFPLKFVRLEPFIVPKSSFTGQTTERVDTRVLQVLYNFEKGELPVYAGQLLDIYIEAQPFNSVIHDK